ncbi:MAG TPA: ribosome maturation factor RimM [Ohtaekwangia sp.]|nr:ribosome maturation factor RimM [Ohtaekwangia sp.]
MDIGSSYKIGFILRPHGLKGEVTISLDPEAPAALSGVESVFVEKDKRLIPYFITSVSASGKKAFVKFEDVDSADAAEAISKSAIYLPKSARPKSSRGEFYDDEVIGFTVSDAQLGDLGTVTGVADAGANRLLVIMHAEKEVLIPVNSPFVLGVNKRKKHVSVDLPEGFLDI